MGQHASQLLAGRGRRHHGRAQRYERSLDARAVPRLGALHDEGCGSRRMKAGAPPTEAELFRFVYDEARLIDEKRLDEWYGLFTDDARYWMPLTRNQPDGENFTSLLYEDKLLLKVRIERLRKPNSFSQQQPSFCQHVLQQPALERADPEANLYV